LVLEIYKVTKTFPNSEKYRLITQIRRSASSIATNILKATKGIVTKRLLIFLI